MNPACIRQQTINKLCVFWLLHWLAVASSHSFSLRHSRIKIRPINNPTAASKCSSERKSHMSLTLNQKLEMIKLRKEGMLKAQIGLERGLLHQTAKMWMQRSSSWRKLKILLKWTHKW